MHTNWNEFEPLLHEVEKPSRYIGGEWNSKSPSAVEAAAAGSVRVGLCYPGTYDVGQANQAISILYDRIPSAERVYLPEEDMAALMRERGVKLSTLETHTPIAELDVLGITLPFELAYTTILEILDLGGIPFRSADRDHDHPVIIGGGPGAFNPEPVADFFDAILLGDGEDGAPEIVAAVAASKAAGETRRALHERLAGLSGVYVPALYDVSYREDGLIEAITPLSDVAPSTVLRRGLDNFADINPPACPIVPYGDVVHDRLSIEVFRGCTRGCRFCQAGMIYRPVRERDADHVVRAALQGLACTGYDDVSLTSLSTADHSQIEEMLRRMQFQLVDRGVSVSLPSLRVDAFSIGLARLISGGSGRKTGLTFAPEAGSQRLRDAINKNVTEEDLIGTIDHAFEAGWRRVKLYFMVGLPTETDDDIRAIGDLVRKVLETAREATPPAQRSAVKVGVSVSTFVPKSHTPFQWEPQADLEEIIRKQQILRESMPRKGVDLSWHDADTSFVEGVLARGDRRVSAAIEEAWRRGSRRDAWSEYFSLTRWLESFEAAGVEPAQTANRQRTFDEVLPWGHLSCGVSPEYLQSESERAYRAARTPDCSFTGCTNCDACDVLGIDIVTAGDRR